MKWKPLLGLFLGCLLMQSCQKHWAESGQNFDAGCWEATDTLLLSFDNTDTNQVYRLQFPLEVTEDYPFNNIYLRAILTSPSGEASVIPSEFKLSSNAGEWYSEPKGDIIPFNLSIADGLRFNQVGAYTVKLFHFMRDDQVCGINRAGIALDQATANAE